MSTTLTRENQEFIPARWETVACPFCGETRATSFERFGFEHRYQYVKCAQCKLAYQNPRPVYDSDFVETAYEVYSDSVDDCWDGKALTPKGEIVHREYSHIVSEIEGLVGRKGRILDIGSNTGFFCKAAKDAGWQPVGVEISKTMVELAKRAYGVDARQGDWMKMDFGAPFDAIYCSHVIEHIPRPDLWLKKMRQCLAPGGVVCLSIPNMDSIDRRYKRVMKRAGLRKDRWEKWRTPDHLYEPCERSMAPFLESFGFKIVAKYTYPSAWDGKLNIWQTLYHHKLRWGAKLRFFLKAA